MLYIACGFITIITYYTYYYNIIIIILDIYLPANAKNFTRQFRDKWFVKLLQNLMALFHEICMVRNLKIRINPI